jgi:multidrug efflux pump subunit AcrA (membrane-fusion protein)
MYETDQNFAQTGATASGATGDMFTGYQVMSTNQEGTVENRLASLESALNEAEVERLELIKDLEGRIKALEYELNKAKTQLGDLKGLNPLYREGGKGAIKAKATVAAK